MAKDYNPVGLPVRIAQILVAVIIVGVFSMVCADSATEPNSMENGDGLGLPLASADDSTDTNVTFTSNAGEVQISGAYSGQVSGDDMVLLLSDKIAVYIRGGVMHYYDGTSDSTPASITISIQNHNIGSDRFDWLYYPDANGLYRSYSGGVPYNIDGKVAGMASAEGYVAISMNDTVTNDNITSPVTATVYDSQNGIDKIRYTWSD